MKAGHKYSTNKSGEVQDIFCIKVGNQRQDSLYNQLKDLIIVADNIGCFDASDYLKGVIENIEPKKPRTSAQVALCQVCKYKQVQQDMLDENKNAIVGCNNLTKKEWENKDIPCPLDGARRIF